MNKEYKDTIQDLINSIDNDYDSGTAIQDRIEEQVDTYLTHWKDVFFVLEHTNNDNAFFDNHGYLKATDSWGALSTLAHSAMVQDIQDALGAK